MKQKISLRLFRRDRLLWQVTTLFFVSFQSLALAQDLSRDWTSVRHAAMGFASVTASNDSESVFSNPAGLARMRNPRSSSSLHEVHFPRMQIMVPEGKLNLVGDNLFTDPERITQKVFDDMAAQQGNAEVHLEASAFPSVVFGGKSKPTFVIGTYFNSQLTVQHQQGQEIGLYDVTRDNTIGVAFGIANVSRAGTFAYGLSVRPNLRYYEHLQNRDHNIEDSPEVSEGVTSLDRSTGIGIDAGILFTAADFWLPTFGLALRNGPLGCAEDIENPYNGKFEQICGSLRSGAVQQGQTRTALDATELRVGLSITPRFRMGTEKLNLRISGEFSPIGIAAGGSSYGYSEVPLEQQLKAGAELFFGHPLELSGFAVRGGVFNSQPTWGAAVSLTIFQLEYASFSRQSSFADGSTVDTREHIASLSTKL